MPATNQKYTLNIDPIDGDRLRITIPEIDVQIETTGNSLTEAVDAGHLAIINYLRKTQSHRQVKTGARAKAS